MTIMQPSLIQSSYQSTPSQPINAAADKEVQSNKETAQSKDAKQDPQIQQIIAKLEARDSEVRAHEAAHIAAGAGVVTGGASFSYQKGPDGNMYAIGGEVPIDTAKEQSPQATIEKMQTVKAAALAPSDPSPTDIKIASTAALMESKARQELRKEEQENMHKNSSENGSSNPYNKNSDPISQKSSFSVAV